MRKLIKKAAILSLVLVLLLAVSATAFAATSFREQWFANDYAANAVAYADIEEYRTYGGISTSTRSGEAYVAVTYRCYLGDPNLASSWTDDERIEDVGTDEAYVDSGDTEAYAVGRASYEFCAYVTTLEGDDFYCPDIVVLENLD